MLRGRCSCAILERPGTPSGTQRACPTPSSFASPSLLRMLSPIIPVHPRDALVSPIIPVHTQKQGGGGYQKEVREAKEVEEVKEANHRRVFLRPAFTTTLINIVGAPTFLLRAR